MIYHEATVGTWPIILPASGWNMLKPVDFSELLQLLKN
jgi:hypothetical protein